MSKIRVLDDSTINKIAAGEVVERPYSIVKELVENAIDALSTVITVEIKNGGKSYIRVTDNGSGIEAEDMELAFLRHSTSKISQVEDLQNIITLGFRGEALASIASVSQLEVLSKTRESNTGKRLLIYSGEVKERSEVGTSNGTTIMVKNLFYNIPVRKKFLKSDMAESGAISDFIYKLALGNPSISFKFIKDGTLVLKTPGSGDMEQTSYSLFGKDFIDSTVRIAHSENGVSVSGILSKSTFSRGNRSHQYLFANGRSVKNLTISKKIESAYRGVIPSNRYPVFVLFLELDPKDIDVNIHPSKTEIRFLKEKELLDLIDRVVRDSLSRENSVLEVELRGSGNSSKQSTVFEKPLEEIPLKKESPSTIEHQPSLLDPETLYSRGKKHCRNQGHSSTKRSTQSYSKEKPDRNQIEVVREHISDEASAVSSSRLPKLKIIGTLFNTYVLCEDSLNKEFLMIDQHAAHERIMYERLSRELMEDSVCVQTVLSSEPITLSLSDMEKLNQYEEYLLKLGFTFEEFGQNTIILRGVPMVFGVPNFKELFIDILDNLEFGIKNSYEMRIEKIMKLACTSAVKAGDDIKTVEIDKLIEELGLCEKPFTCPHGRPTVIKLTKAEIEKKFKRI